LAIVVVALAPVGLRVLAWRAPASQAVDPAMAQAGGELFQHEWTPNDPLAAGGDGLGPVFNATSCTACHHKGGVGGSGGIEDNVTAFSIRTVAGGPAREGVVHTYAIDKDSAETLADVDASLPRVSQVKLTDLINVRRNASNNGCGPIRPEVVSRFPQGVDVSQRNTPALFGAKLIDEIPDRAIIANEKKERLKWGLARSDGEDVPVGHASRLANGRVGHFGWKAQTASLSDFVQAACANELGLGNPGQAQPRPLGKKNYQSPSGYDLTTQQCDQLTAYVASLGRPVERLPADARERARVVAGKKRFAAIGCADCHTPDVASVQGIYSDLLLHKMGEALVGGGSYGEPPAPLPNFPPGEGPSPSEWRTPPLWGVADSAPYLHDGRAASLDEAIRLHGGQAARAVRSYSNLGTGERDEVIAFLQTLKAP
jgi:CxxC motif-containing protein (DUF1111 family)